jgi:UDP:flavonoid glycosyltransferase YjiC (YdhE family)
MATHIGCFISPHGYGHATRTIALLETLHALVPDLYSHIFTTVPEQLFHTAAFPFTYHPCENDVGLVHDDSLQIDPVRTVAQLRRTIPYAEATLESCAELCRDCSIIHCDISALGIEVARRVGVPSLLVENFTWDWIYTPLAETTPDLLDHIDYFTNIYSRADFRIQTEPVCNPIACDLTSAPIARGSRKTPAEIAPHFDSRNRPIILLTMGGIPLALPFLGLLEDYRDYFFIIAGQPKDSPAPGDHIRLLDRETELYHPDLIELADLVICKTGYSTIAECARTETPICCVQRADFAESAVLESFVEKEMQGTLIDGVDFFSGRWLADLPLLLEKNRYQVLPDGRNQAAAFIQGVLGRA